MQRRHKNERKYQNHEILQQGMIMPKFWGGGSGCKVSRGKNIQQKLNILYFMFEWEFDINSIPYDATVQGIF